MYYYYRELAETDVPTPVRTAASQGMRAAMNALGMQEAPRIKWFVPCNAIEWRLAGSHERYRQPEQIFGIANPFTGLSLNAMPRSSVGIFGTAAHETRHMFDFQNGYTPKLKAFANDANTDKAEHEARAFVARLLARRFFPAIPPLPVMTFGNMKDRRRLARRMAN